MHKLRVRELSKSIKQASIVNGVSLDICSGEIIGLLGPNGAGKTTTFYMICGLTTASSGRVVLDRSDITHLSLSARAKLGIGYLPQESSIFKDLSVEDNLLMAAEAARLGRDEEHSRVEKLLELFNIEPIRKRKGIQLSGGERRRVEIARALIAKPKFLLLDEPFAGVDPIAVIDIQNIIKQLVTLGIGVLITDHNVRETLGICDRAYVLRDGSMLASGTSEELIADTNVRKYYLGDNFSY